MTTLPVMKPPTSAKAVQVDAAPWSSFYLADLELPAELRPPLNVSTYRRMRRDPQIASLLMATWMPILRTQARLDADGVREEVAQHCAVNLGLPLVGQEVAPRQLRTRDRFSWAQHLRHVLLQDVYGYSAFNQVYRYNENSKRYDIRKLLWIPPWTVDEIKTAADGGLVAVKQNMVGAQSVPVSELVWHANGREGANWAGVPLMLPCWQPWLLKDRLQRVGVLSVERNGMGLPVYTAPPREAIDDPDGARAAADIAAGLEIAKGARSGEAAGASLANGSDFELLGVTGSLPDSTVLIRYFDEQMARSFLGHFLNLGTETGSWALGSTFADFFTLSLGAKAEEIADVTTQHVIEDLVDVNWGPEEPAPRLVFDEIGSQSAATVEALKLLHDAGLLDEDEVLKQFIRVRFKLPKPAQSSDAPVTEEESP